MGIIEQMAGYGVHLHANTPAESKGKPVTEIAIFKLKTEYAQDHAAALSEFKEHMVTNCTPGVPHAKGIRRIAWGFAVDDPGMFVWVLDWDKIECHWDFWLAPGFPPVMATITKIFEPGRPLVRHYDFGGAGSLDKELEFVRIMVWDDGEEGKREGKAKALGNGKGKAADSREGYAVDIDETTAWCSMLGYKTEEDARAAEVTPGEDAVSNIYQLEYSH
ncbi:hypothetical protein F5X68DRAFT_242754 [Plectosphaerella plurivora]|uniref:Uncharacterized protein n=1 Tax=Plectosphaerella plurivora TaxID=936078 RepID=A0A9P8V7A4_9PEZI|nr:hypothetical protein F5X68DRAFT_242754 [Plectosphaerella plurivora]